MPKSRHEQVDQVGLEYRVGGLQITDRYTVAGLPAASTANSGFIVYVTNASGGPILAWSDGVSWKRLDTNATVT